MSSRDRQRQSSNGYGSDSDNGRGRQNSRGNGRSRSRSPRGRAPSQEMLNRPVTAQDLPNLRLVDLQALAKSMGLNVPRNMDKMVLAETIAYELDVLGPVFLDGNVANLTSGGQQRSPRGGQGGSMQFDQQAFAAFIIPLIKQSTQMNQGNSFGGYRSRWQYLISQVTQWARDNDMPLNAAQAAKMLDPYYKSQRERQANEPGNQSRGRYNSQNRQLAFGTGGTTTGYNRRRGSGNFDNMLDAFNNMSITNVNQQELSAFVDEFMNNFNGNQNEFRSQWQALISATARRFGISATDAAVMLDPYYESQSERQANELGNQSRGRRNNQSPGGR